MTAPRSAAPDGEIVFDAILTPHRALSPAAIWAVVAVFGASSLILGLVFALSGAWPVLGFYGLDVAILTAFLWHNFRDGRRYERVTVTPSGVRVERGDWRGHRQILECGAAWLRVDLAEDRSRRLQVVVTALRRRMVLGAFLSPAEKRDFATALANAVRRAQLPDHMRRVVFD